MMKEGSVVDRHRLGDMDPDLDPTFQLDADPDPGTSLSFTHGFLFTAVPIYIVISFSSAS
jgi:hypothetical protein